MSHLLAVLLGCVACELLFRLPLLRQVRTISTALPTALEVMRDAKLSDEEKQKRMLASSKTVFLATLALALFLVLWLGVLYGLFLLAAQLLNLPHELLYSWLFLGIMTAGSVAYYFVRKNLV